MKKKRKKIILFMVRRGLVWKLIMIDADPIHSQYRHLLIIFNYNMVFPTISKSHPIISMPITIKNHPTPYSLKIEVKVCNITRRKNYNITHICFYYQSWLMKN